MSGAPESEPTFDDEYAKAMVLAGLGGATDIAAGALTVLLVEAADTKIEVVAGCALTGMGAAIGAVAVFWGLRLAREAGRKSR